MATYKLASFFDADGNKLSIGAADVYYKTAKMKLNEFLDSLNTSDVVDEKIADAIDELFNKDGDDHRVADIDDKLTALEKTVNDFLTGDVTDNDTVDRLKELIQLIKDNKDNIDGIMSDYVKKADIVDNLTSESTEAPLSANQGKVIADRLDALEGDTHTHDNKELLDAISKNENSGNLVYNGKELTGETGIAMGASLEAANVFTSKLRVVVENYEEPTV